MIKQEDDGLWIYLEETIQAHHDDVFECLSTAAGLERWFPVAAKIEARPGGKVVLGWDRDFERKSTVAVLDFDAGGRIVWDWHASHQDTHAPVYLAVIPTVDKGSTLQLRQGPFFDDKESLIAMAEEATSWQWRLCNLRVVLEGKMDMRKVRPL